jgi:hypothetical protein
MIYFGIYLQALRGFLPMHLGEVFFLHISILAITIVVGD